MNTFAFLASICVVAWLGLFAVIVLFIHGATGRPTPPPPANRDAEARR